MKGERQAEGMHRIADVEDKNRLIWERMLKYFNPKVVFTEMVTQIELRGFGCA